MRINYWDNWKGIAIIAVVTIHACAYTGKFPEGSFNWLFGLGVRQLLDFAVPVFLALSGYFSVKPAEGGLIQYYKSRFAKILIPYLIWTGIYLILKTPSTPPSLGELIGGVLMGNGIGIGYFVIVLSQFIILTPLLSRISKFSIHIFIIVSISLLGSAFTYYFAAVNQAHLLSKFPAYALPFFVWYPFYHVGYLLARYSEDLKAIKSQTNKFILGYTAFIAVSFCEGLFWAYEQNYSFGVSQLKASSFAASLFLFLIIVSFSGSKTFLSKRSILTWLGSNSYPIYLMHMMLLFAIQKALKIFDPIYSVQPLFIALATAGSIAACSLIIVGAKRVFSRPVVIALFGN